MLGRWARCTLLIRWIALSSIFVVGLLACNDVPPPKPQRVASYPTNAAAKAFPLTRSAGHRCLSDQQARPFLVHGDAAWSLIAQLDRLATLRYLDNRRAKGFNTLIVNLIEHHFSKEPPVNAYGQAPFHGTDSFVSPNESYFEHVDWVLAQAAERGFLVLLAPAYLGYEGGNEGWYKEMRKAKLTTLEDYGGYLGARYANFTNVIWLHGGDFNPPDMSPTLAVMKGIRRNARSTMHSFHGARGTVATQFLADGDWLDLNTIYTGESTVVTKTREAAGSDLPSIFIEGQYENVGVDDLGVRTQAYQAVLSGACGQIIGNRPVWAFEPGWDAELDSPAARAMVFLRKFLESNGWPMIRPLENQAIRVASTHGAAQPVAALSPSGQILGYLPVNAMATLHHSVLSEGHYDLTWIDPQIGTTRAKVAIVRTEWGDAVLRPPGPNVSGHGDWLFSIGQKL